MEFQQGFLVRFNDFVGAWLPGTQLKSRPELHALFLLAVPAWELPNLSLTHITLLLAFILEIFFVWLKTGGQPFLGEKFVEEKEIPLMPMVVLAPVSAHEGPYARPLINVSRNFLAHMSAESPSNMAIFRPN